MIEISLAERRQRERRKGEGGLVGVNREGEEMRGGERRQYRADWQRYRRGSRR
jgi:hypothetical protein